MGKMEPGKVRNLQNGTSKIDRLSKKSKGNPGCCPLQCRGSIMRPEPERSPGIARPQQEVVEQAEAFFEEYYEFLKQKGSAEHLRRIDDVKASISRTGSYELTTDELSFGSKTAWRNAARCIGRIQWKNLEIQDARHVKTASEMFECIKSHLKLASSTDTIKSCITIFPQRTTSAHDFRVWNPQLISYAGYKRHDNTFIGDPAYEEFTKACMRLGWRGKGTHFDVLPIVLQAHGGPPEWFELPDDCVVEVPLTHPEYPWFGKMGLKWFGVPAVSGMLFDCGGIEFPAVPFNGWYMSTEVACRDLCDPGRYNLLEIFGKNLGLDTRQNANLWKDKVLVEVNYAVLCSYKKAGVTLVDHHTASEQFLTHMDTEFRVRGGCPADWVWIVPPMSSSITGVFHVEMLNYKLKPSYEYQVDPWKTYKWPTESTDQKRRIGTFKSLMRIIMICTRFMHSAISRRTKCTILYATETGKSYKFAEGIMQMMNSTFNARVLAMDEYSAEDLDTEQLLLMVASTFGNGEAPENGRIFHQLLKSRVAKISKLRNIKYAVLALGSTAYPNFCKFGQDLHDDFARLGAETLLDVRKADELSGQEDTFKLWLSEMFRVACSKYLIEDASIDINTIMTHDIWSKECFKIRSALHQSDRRIPDLKQGREHLHKRKIACAKVKSRTQLQSNQSTDQTFHLVLDVTDFDISYQPGDHAVVYPSNLPSLVDGMFKQMKIIGGMETPLEVKYKTHGWVPYTRFLHGTSMREMLLHYLDLTSAPTQAMLAQLVQFARTKEDITGLEKLATNINKYTRWRSDKCPTFLDVLREFQSLKIEPSFLISQLPILKPRFYSISSSQKAYPGELHLTVSEVVYHTQQGTTRHGVCSNWISKLNEGDVIHLYVKSNPQFHLPANHKEPIIMISAGSGIAPFRGFWQQLEVTDVKPAECSLYFGCRHPQRDDLYRIERDRLIKQGVLDSVHVAYSRLDAKKVYVQHLLLKNKVKVYDSLIQQNGHIYICGAIAMAQDVRITITKILMECGHMTDGQAETFLTNMKNDGQWHEDIFGVVDPHKANQSLVNGDHKSVTDERPVNINVEAVISHPIATKPTNNFNKLAVLPRIRRTTSKDRGQNRSIDNSAVKVKEINKRNGHRI